MEQFEEGTGPRAWIKKAPVVNRLIRTRSFQRFRHQIVRYRQPRRQSTYTHFFRIPTQFEALSGPVLDHISNGRALDSLRVAVVGCSTGAEAYTISSVLLKAHPDLKVHVHATDISPQVIEEAKVARYSADMLYDNRWITEEFIAYTFDRDGDDYVVRTPIAERVEFGVADVFSCDLPDKVPQADIVFAQNFLFHMKPAVARGAFDCVCSLLRPRCALFVDGTDLPVRAAGTRRHGLVPLDYKIPQIHGQNLHLDGWPWHYWGLEPLSQRRPDWKRWYGTIFLRS